MTEKISFITLTNDGYKHYTLNCLESLKKFNLNSEIEGLLYGYKRISGNIRKTYRMY